LKLYTSSWFVKLPGDHLRVGISRSTPRRISGFRRLRALEPGLWFNAASPEEFHKLYMAQLNALDVAAIVVGLEAMAADAQAVAVVFVCYEAPHGGAWCHRSLISAWLHDRLGLEVPEYGLEGCGARHPLRWRGR
jgi:hypothetical protein